MTLGGIILGAPKCGTTSIYHYLQQHPDIVCPMPKEAHFLLRAISDAYPEPTWGDGFNVDVGTDTAYHEKALETLANEYPNAKAVLLVRNPVDLAVSLHSQRTKTGGETRPLPDALDDAHLAPLQASTNRPGLVGYLEAAQLGTVVERVQRILGKQVLVLPFSWFQKDPQAVLNKILDHFGLDPFAFDVRQDHNPDIRPRSNRIVRFLQKPPAWLASPWRKLPQSFRDAVGSRLNKWNQQTHQRRVDETVREHLTQLLAADMQSVNAVESQYV